jgi:hypothetical protein
MPTTPATPAPGDATVERSVDEQFLALLCSDEELLQAEFDAIIAAEWPEPPGSLPRPGAAGRTPERGRPGRCRPGARPRRPQPHPLGGDARRRQRSPPLRHATHDRQEGR